METRLCGWLAYSFKFHRSKLLLKRNKQKKDLISNFFRIIPFPSIQPPHKNFNFLYSKPPPLQSRPKPAALTPRPNLIDEPSFVVTSQLMTSADMKDDRDKWNRCRYQCSICEVITIDSRQMRLHIATQHNMTYDE